MTNQLRIALPTLFCILLSACDLPQAHGDANALIVAAEPALWDEIEETFRSQMEPTIQAVRNERPFRITYQDPTDLQNWTYLQRFRQVLVLGDAGDPWVAEVLEKADAREVGTPPTIIQVQNVWSRGQQVSLLLLDESDPSQETVETLASTLRATLEEQYESYALNRMFITGRNQALADSLAENVGFSIIVPEVYRYSVMDSVFRFRNDNPSPSELIREVGVTWHTPIPEELPTRAELEAWRRDFTETYYNDPQHLDTLVVTYGEVTTNGLEGVGFQSAWVSPPDAWPAGGPFITRALACPAQDRLYFVDAWLYAPGRDKYEYMIQLRTLLDSFRCH